MPGHHAVAETCHLDRNRVNASWPIYSVDPQEPRGYCKQAGDVCPSISLPLERIWSELLRAFPSEMSWYVINAGARDGVLDDPIFPIATKHPNISGIAIEPDMRAFPKLIKSLSRFPNYVPRNESIFPNSAVEALKRGPGAPKASPHSIDVLKSE
jgi:hypothetical protein